MTSPIVDFSEIDLTGSVKFEDQQIGSVYYNGERLWPFGVDLLYTGGIGGASYLPDPADVYGNSALAAFGEGVSAVLDEKNGTPVLGPELVTNGDFSDGSTGWNLGTGWSVSGGEAVKAAGTGSSISRNIGAVAGRTYQVTINVTRTAGFAFIRIGSISDNTVGVSSTGTFTRFVVAGSIDANFYFFGDSAFVGTIDNISVRELPGIHARQPSASLRPLLGRAPKERRNLLTYTEQFDNAFWNKTGTSISATTEVAPDGSATADKVAETAVTDLHQVQVTRIYTNGVPYVWSAYVKAAERSWAILNTHTGFDRLTWFDLTNGVVGTTASGVVASITNAGNGWWRLSAVRTSTGTSGFFSIGVATADGVRSYAGTAGSGILIWGAQLELGSTATAYQRVGAATDVTEAGVPSYPFVRFDLSDDRLDTVLPQAVTGDVVIAGRNGSVITPQSYTANTTFQLGPTSYTGGTPGILSAIGDVVGWSILNKTLTAAERERIMRFYKRRGAKGLLVPGPELVTNGDFSGGSTGWTDIAGGTTSSFTGGQCSFTLSAGFRGVYQPKVIANGVWLKITFDVVSLSGGTVEVIGKTVADGLSAVTCFYTSATTTGSKSAIALTTASCASIAVRNSTSGTTTVIDNISVRELRPEEEW